MTNLGFTRTNVAAGTPLAGLVKFSDFAASHFDSAADRNVMALALADVLSAEELDRLKALIKQAEEYL